MKFPWSKKPVTYSKQLAEILAQVGNKEDLLGVKEGILPKPEDIRRDSAKLYRYSQSEDYKRFADEAWARIVDHLDKIFDPRSSNEVRTHHCGAAQATLDLLRISYQARTLLDQLDQEKQASSQS